MKSIATIRASISPHVLDKADLLFTNDDRGIWAELLQNARRAGATLVTVTIRELEKYRCLIEFQDNGSGIEDFQKLLTLGGSGWEASTQEKEDPAGMGFFSLCRSVVTVHSHNARVEIRPEVFLGKAAAVVESCEEYVRGTRLRFIRETTKFILTAALKQVTEFCPVDVYLNGAPLPRHDFLEGALHREIIDGIEVGFAPGFSLDWHYDDQNWNFFGARLRGPADRFDGFLPPHGDKAPQTLYTRFNVLETAKVKLQLPDRRAIVEDGRLVSFKIKVRAAAYRFFQAQQRHDLPYKNWVEAQQLGIELPEAVCRLTSWHAGAQDDAIEPPFGYGTTNILPDLADVALVSGHLPNPHTFEGALHSGAELPWRLYEQRSSAQGYSWYDTLPTITGCQVLMDGASHADCLENAKERPQKIEVKITVAQAGLPASTLEIPAVIHVNSESTNQPDFVAIKHSPWDNDEVSGPFSVTDFLMWATFMSSDSVEADSWETQRDRYESEIDEEIDRYFRGPKATLLSILRKTLGWKAKNLAEELGVREIRFIKDDSGDRNWNVETMK